MQDTPVNLARALQILDKDSANYILWVALTTPHAYAKRYRSSGRPMLGPDKSDHIVSYKTLPRQAPMIGLKHKRGLSM